MTDTIERTNIIPHTRLETLKLIDKLKSGRVGDVLTDEELTSVCGKDTSPQTAGGTPGPGYCYLNSAIRNVRRNYNVVWERVKGAGAIKCLSPCEIADSATSDRKSIHRRANVACAKMRTVELSDVPDDERQRFLTTAAHLGTLSAMSSSKTHKKLEARNVSEPLDMKRLLENLKDAT